MTRQRIHHPASPLDPSLRSLDRLGSHLLGRKFKRDDRDWKIERLLELETRFRPDETIQNLADDPLFDKYSPAFLWQYVLKLRQHPLPPPPPPPIPTTGWADLEPILDQGQTGHCVGFGWCQWGNTLPMDDRWTNQDGHSTYYAAKIVDGEPGAEDGSYVRSGAEVMKQRGRLLGYAFATSLSDIDYWLSAKGPIVVGTSWTQAMFTPDSNFIIRPTGAVAGGHCYLLFNQIAVGGLVCYAVRNSWGNWANNGVAYIPKTDFAGLLASQGEACLALEQPV